MVDTEAVVAVTASELVVLAHLRNDRHDAVVCRMCQTQMDAFARGYSNAIKKIAEG